MPIFEYKCPECRLLSEKIVMPGEPTPKMITCPRCKAPAPKQEFPSSISLSRSGMDNAPVDNFIGRDAERRWEDINRRQQARDTTRTTSGETGLTMTGRNQFQPLTTTQKELRTSLNEAVVADGGFKNTDPVPGSR